MGDCPRCRATLRAGARFCRRCGERLAEGDGDAPVVAPAAAGAAPREAAWAIARPAVTLFLASLAVGGAVLAVSRVRPQLGPPGELVASALEVVILAVLARDDRRALRSLVVIPRIEHPLRLLGLVAAGAALVRAYFAVVLRAFDVPEGRVLEGWSSLGWSPLFAWFLVCVHAPVVEEVAFRGFVQTRLARVMGAREAWRVQAALFAVLHLSPWMFPSHFVLGLVLGHVRRETRSIVPGVILHAAWNAAALARELT